MLKTPLSLVLALVPAAASGGCASAPTEAASSAAAEMSTGTFALADAQAQVAAVRARFEPQGVHELLFDTSLAPAYVAAVKPIFARTASADKIALAGDAFTYVSNEVQVDALVDGDLLDDAVAASYHDLWDYSFYFGLTSSRAPGYWPKLGGLVSRSKDGALSDLQVLELAANAQPSDLVTGLNALHWSAAPRASATNVKRLVDADKAIGAAMNLAFGPVEVAADGRQHDLQENDAFGAKLLSQSLSDLRFLDSSTEGDLLFELANHLTEAKENDKHDATVGLSIAKSALTPAETRQVEMHL